MPCKSRTPKVEENYAKQLPREVENNYAKAAQKNRGELCQICFQSSRPEK